MFVFRKKNKDGKKIDQLLALLENDPENTKNRLKLADLYVRAGDKKSALPEYQRAAKYLSEEGFNLKAISIYKKILTLDGMSWNDYKSLASLYTEEGLLAEARRTYERILQIRPQDRETEEALKDLESDGERPADQEARNAPQEDNIQAKDSSEPVPIETLLPPSQHRETRHSPSWDVPAETPEETDMGGLSEKRDTTEEDFSPDHREDPQTSMGSLQTDDALQTMQSPDKEDLDSGDSLQGKLVQDLAVEDFMNVALPSEETDTPPTSPSPLDGPQSSPFNTSEAHPDSLGDDPNLHYHLGVAYREMELTDKAIEEFLKAFQQGNNPLECLIMLARCYFEKGLFEEAAEFIHRALKLESLTQHQINLLHRQLKEVEAVGKLD